MYPVKFGFTNLGCTSSGGTSAKEPLSPALVQVDAKVACITGGVPENESVAVRSALGISRFRGKGSSVCGIVINEL